MNLLQAYRNCYYVIPKDAEFREFNSLYNQLLPESMRICDNNNKPSTDEFKIFLEQIKRSIPDQRENFTNMLLNKSLTQEDKLMKLKDITKDHPDLFEKVKEYCLINNSDIDQIASGYTDDREEIKETYNDERIDEDQHSSQKHDFTQNSIEERIMVEDEPSNFSARHEHVNNRLNEIAPKMGIIMSGCFFGADEAEILLRNYLLENPDLSDEFLNLLLSREVSRRANSWFTKPISEFSLANSKIIDKSYTMFPSDFPDQICSGMDNICKQVLNEKYVSVPRGSEFFSFHLK